MNVDNFKDHISYLKKNAISFSEFQYEFIELHKNNSIDNILIRFIELVKINLTDNQSTKIKYLGDKNDTRCDENGEIVVEMSKIDVNRHIYLNFLLTLYFYRQPENKEINKYIFCLIYTVIEIDKMINNAPNANLTNDNLTNIMNPEYTEFIRHFQETVNHLFQNQLFGENLYQNITMVEAGKLFIDIFTYN